MKHLKPKTWSSAFLFPAPLQFCTLWPAAFMNCCSHLFFPFLSCLNIFDLSHSYETNIPDYSPGTIFVVPVCPAVLDNGSCICCTHLCCGNIYPPYFLPRKALAQSAAVGCYCLLIRAGHACWCVCINLHSFSEKLLTKPINKKTWKLKSPSAYY